MIKKTIFTLMFMTVMGWVSAQSLQFEWEGQVFGEGETIECTNDEYGFGEFIQHMQIRNLTSNDLNVLVEKEVVGDLEGTMNFFCWGVCLSPDVSVSPRAITVAANSLNTDDLSFHVMFEEEVYGKVVIIFKAYDETQSGNPISIKVVFNRSGAGVREAAPVQFGQAYPNPASSVVNFDYNINAGDRASVSIYNLLGQEVKNLSVNTLQGRLSVSVIDLNEGIYFCKLFVNGCAVKTEKFLVKK